MGSKAIRNEIPGGRGIRVRKIPLVDRGRLANVLEDSEPCPHHPRSMDGKSLGGDRQLNLDSRSLEFDHQGVLRGHLQKDQSDQGLYPARTGLQYFVPVVK